MTKYYDPITPGEYLEHEFLEPLGLTQSQISRDIDVPISRINGIVKGSRAITADTAIRLGIYFKTSAQMWLNLQAQYDLKIAQRKNLASIQNRVQVFKAVA
ncbi:MAG: addiction module antidote protein, HigA family [Rickettsiales bacterium]|nr:MAG: addiction module antidote protein, HigA family [Rickettsiales bacterium]